MGVRPSDTPGRIPGLSLRPGRWPSGADFSGRGPPLELLALDFDGVISDSAPESWWVCLRTYAALRPSPAVEGLCAAAEAASADEIRADEAYRRFLRMMPLGNRAEDFAVALSLILGDRDAADQAAFDDGYEAEPAAFLTAFHEAFYATRARLRERDPDRWISLLGPYPPFLEILHRRAGQVGLAIATAKDRPSVRRLLREYGIDPLFPEEALLDKEAGRSKRVHLSRLRDRFGLPFEQIVFVDDKVNHLDDVSSLGVSGVLASWGYNGAREHAQARERGHRVCSLEDFDATLFG